MQILLLNFSHPLTEAQFMELANHEKLNPTLLGIKNIPVSVDFSKSLVEQATAIVDAVGLNPTDWQNQQLLVRLPGMADVAALVLAEIHGRCGYFPRIVNIANRDGQFVVNAVIDLRIVRDQARTRRFRKSEE